MAWLPVTTPDAFTAIEEGEPVVLLHGFPEHWWQWHAVAPMIASRGYRVLCPDLRGAGWTVADDPTIQRETRLHDLLALLDALDVERAHLVSHDMAVITATQLTYEHPERVRTAVQLSVWPGFFSFSPRLLPAFVHLPPLIWHRPGASLRWTFSTRYAARPMTEATMDTHLAPMLRPDIDAAVRPLVRRMILPEALRMMRGVYRNQRLTVPTLVVFGRRDHPRRKSSWGASAVTRSGTPNTSSSPTSTTRHTSSPTTHPPPSPTSHSTGSNEPGKGTQASCALPRTARRHRQDGSAPATATASRRGQSWADSARSGAAPIRAQVRWTSRRCATANTLTVRGRSSSP